MCQKRNSGKTVLKGKSVRVDECLKNIVGHLNNSYYTTLGSCCGHNKYPTTIVARDEIDGRIIELFSNKEIPRKRRFYIKDKDGYFFIPEVVNCKQH